MVSTVISDVADLGSIPNRTYQFLFCFCFFLFLTLTFVTSFEGITGEMKEINDFKTFYRGQVSREEWKFSEYAV